MLNKNKNIFKKVSLAIMILASSLGFIDIPFKIPKTSYLSRPALIAVQSLAIRNPYFREREDTEAHYVGYSESQRIISRSGSI